MSMFVVLWAEPGMFDSGLWPLSFPVQYSADGAAA